MRTAPFKYLCTDSGQYGLNVASSDYRNEGVPLLRTSDISETTRESEAPLVEPPNDERFLLRSGDLLLSRSGSVGQAHLVDTTEESSTFAGYLIRFRPNGSVTDARYPYYLAKSDYFARAIAADSVVSTIANFNADRYANINVPFPDFEQQRRIADFLDDQVARIDNIISARELQVSGMGRLRSELLPGLLGTTSKAWLGRNAESIRETLPRGWAVAEFGHLLDQLTNGFVGPTRDILVDDGVPYVQSLHIKNGVIDFERRPYYVRPEWHQARPRINLRFNDVLIVQTGDIGQVALVPEDFGEASCHALLIARVNNAVVLPAYFAEYLRSSLGRQELLARATGALHPHLEYGIKESPIVLPPLKEQARLVRELRLQNEYRARAYATAVELTSRLTELKRSLITAAVSGEFDVSAADGSGVVV